MKKYRLNGVDQVSLACVDSILHTVENNNKAQICYATGKSVAVLYEQLKTEAERREIDFSDTKAFQLDEYYEILNEPSLYMHNIILKLFEELKIKRTNQFVHQVTGDKEKDLNFYRSLISSPFDLTILGVGLNGHIAYNEPGSMKNNDFQIVKLEQQSIQNTLGYGFDEDDVLPQNGITIGLSTIYDSEKIILIALGESKKEVMKRFINCKQFDSDFPVSVLCDHPNLEVYTDFDL